MCHWKHDKKSSLFLSQFWKQLFLKQPKERCKRWNRQREKWIGIWRGLRSRAPAGHTQGRAQCPAPFFKMKRTLVHWTISVWVHKCQVMRPFKSQNIGFNLKNPSGPSSDPEHWPTSLLGHEPSTLLHDVKYHNRETFG